jgi:hypothetical protein
VCVCVYVCVCVCACVCMCVCPSTHQPSSCSCGAKAAADHSENRLFFLLLFSPLTRSRLLTCTTSPLLLYPSERIVHCHLNLLPSNHPLDCHLKPAQLSSKHPLYCYPVTKASTSLPKHTTFVLPGLHVHRPISGRKQQPECGR